MTKEEEKRGGGGAEGADGGRARPKTRGLAPPTRLEGPEELTETTVRRGRGRGREGAEGAAPRALSAEGAEGATEEGKQDEENYGV